MSAKNLEPGDRVRYVGDNPQYTKRVGYVQEVPTVLTVLVEWDGFEGVPHYHFWNSVEYME